MTAKDETNSGLGLSSGEIEYLLKRQLIELLKQREDLLMGSARVVSNMKRPESDNNYGRAAMKLKEAREALEKLI
jgi:hypothetical protein